MEIIVVQTAFIGDVVLVTPVFEALRLSRPDTRITAVVRPSCVNIIETSPYVDDIIAWDKRGKGGCGKVLRLLRRRRPDCAIVPHRSFRTGLTLFMAGIPERIGFDRGGGKLFHTRRVPYCGNIHEVERNLSLVSEAGYPVTGVSPGIFVDDADRRAVDVALPGNDRLCVFAPGSVWPTKRWPAGHYAALGKRLHSDGYRVVLSGSAGDRDLCDGIAAAVPGAVNTAGDFTVRQSAELYRRAAFVVTGDTAPQHIAAAMGSRVFALFGPTVRDFGFSPYTEKGTVIEENLDCRPCHIHGPRACPLGTHACMRNITPERVYDIISASMQ